MKLLHMAVFFATESINWQNHQPRRTHHLTTEVVAASTPCVLPSELLQSHRHLPGRYGAIIATDNMGAPPARPSHEGHGQNLSDETDHGL